MSELSESVYFQTNERRQAVQWLEDAGLVGYVLRPKGQWVQVFPGWDVANEQRKTQALGFSSGLVVHYFYDTDEQWAATFYDDGQRLGRYECEFDTDHCVCQAGGLQDLAKRLDVPADRLTELLAEDIASGWAARADRAAALADLLALPNYAYASYDYAEMDAEITGMSDLFVDLPDDDDEDEEQSNRADGDDDGQSQADDIRQAGPPAPEPKQRGDGNAPWQAAYDLASQFLLRLHDEQYIELTFDSRLVRDRLIERLTKTVIENPISSPDQLVAHWLDNLMEAPEIVDIFATDDMLFEAFEQAMAMTMDD